MIHVFRREALDSAQKFFDVLLVVASAGLANFVVSWRGGEVSAVNFLSKEVRVGNVLVFFGLLFLSHLVFSASGAYPSNRLSQQQGRTSDVVHATSLVALIVAAGSVLQTFRLSPWFILAFWISLTSGACLSRLLLIKILALLWSRGGDLRAVLVVGTNTRSVEFARKLTANHGLGYRVIGFADDDWHGLSQFAQGGNNIICDLNGVPDFLRSHVVDEVIIGLPMQSGYSQASRIVGACEEQGIIIRVLPGLFDLKVARSRSDELDGESVLTLYTAKPMGWPAILKRVLDFGIAAILLLVLAPMFLIVALAIKLKLPGPIIEFQKRLGLNKREFNLIKFRTAQLGVDAFPEPTMVSAYAAGSLVDHLPGSHKGSLGKFLRATSLDELPQLFNVLRGDLSLVGPRPLPVRDYRGFDQDWQRRRFSVRPGIICLWQLDDRARVSFERWMEMDIEYVDSWSLWLDLKILLRAVPVALKGAGAA